MLDIIRRIGAVTLFSSLVLLSLVATPTHAGDWDGPYAGVSVGGRTVDVEWETTQIFSDFGIPFALQSDPFAFFVDTDFRAGGYVGYNWQPLPQWVFGVEGDFGYSDNYDMINLIPGLNAPPSSPTADGTTSIEADWDINVRVRGGFLVRPNILVFASMGLSALKVESTVTCFQDGPNCNPARPVQMQSKAMTLRGWTGGVGVEGLFAGRWLPRFEYRLADYGKHSFNALAPIFGAVAGADAQIDVISHFFLASIAYKFW